VDSGLKRRKLIWILVGAAVVAATLILSLHHWRPPSITIQGAVIRRDADSHKQSPISGAVITAFDGTTNVSTESDASGYFKLTLRGTVRARRTVNLSVRHPDYLPFDFAVPTGLRLAIKEIYIAAMEPIAQPSIVASTKPQSVVSNIRIRYTVNSENVDNIGSAVKTFQVANQGNIPCDHREPCSPDGTWKASRASASLDAGPGNEFRSVRASCIAGPCPYTRIDSSGYANGGRIITVSALNWSDTVTILLEAEVFHASIRSNVRQSYPVVFGRSLNFTLPPTQEGVSIEAEVDGTPMVFPLGPELFLSWATCTARTSADEEKTTVYNCELKPGYSF